MDADDPALVYDALRRYGWTSDELAALSVADWFCVAAVWEEL